MRIFIFNLFWVSIFLKFLFEYVCACMHAHVCMCTCVYGYEFGRMERNKAFHQKASPSLYGTVLGYSTHPPKILASIICWPIAFCFAPYQPLLLEKPHGESHDKIISSQLNCELCPLLIILVHYHDSHCFGMTPPGKAAIADQGQQVLICVFSKTTL